MKEYKWEPITRKQLLRKMNHYKRLLHLRDWKLYLNTKSMPCKVMKLYQAEKGYDDANVPSYRNSGETFVREEAQEAYIWVSLALAKEANNGGENATEVLLHEMLHVFSAAYRDNEELRVRILSEVIFPLLGEIK